MAQTLKFGGGQWATKVGSTLAYNDENGNFKPLPFNFTRATSATRVNKDGLIEVVTNNKPRIDFKDDANGALLLEPERRNLFLRSEEFENAYWATGNATVTENTTTAPNGTLTADKLTASTTGTDRRIQRTDSLAAGTYTTSIFVKSAELNTVRMYAVDFSSQATFNLSEGTVSSILGGATANIENYGNGWYRCSITITYSGGSTQTLYLNIGNALGGATINAGDGVFIWGAQLEAGSYATSYIPTQGSQVTRVQDTCSQTPPSGIIGQTEGTVLFDYTPYDVSTSISEDTIPLAISNNGSISDTIYLNDYNGNLDLFIRVGGTVQAQIQFSSLADNQRFKIGIGYAVNDLVLYVNGVQIGIDTPLSLPTCNQIKLNGFTSNVHINRINVNDVKLYNTRLSNAELQQLTSL